MEIKKISKVFYSGAKQKTRRTVIPIEIAELLDINKGDTLIWNLTFEGSEPVLYVKPVHTGEEEG